MIDRVTGRQHIAWDIETTGFASQDAITAAGFWFPCGYAELIVNTEPIDSSLPRDACESQLADVSGGVSVTVTQATDESELLAAMRRIVFERFDRNYDRLVAFNAESWKNGFDLPFVRTRCLEHGHDWIFDGIEFADLWDPIRKRLNTTHTIHGKQPEINDLAGAHATLLGRSSMPPLDIDDVERHPWYHDHQYDPFDDSGRAVTCYRQGELNLLLQHNLADIHRTWELGELVRTFVSSKDITTKKL